MTIARSLVGPFKRTVRRVLSVLAFVAAFGTTTSAQVIPSDRAALEAIYVSTNGGVDWCTDPATCNWMGPIGTECTWGGITCSSDGLHVTQLNLAWNPVSGTLPPEIGDLTELTFLGLNNTSLGGSIPPEIGNLVKLKTLTLGGHLTGPIPEEIGNLVELENLSVPYLGLSGPIPDSIGNLVHLKSFNARENNRQGPGLESPPSGMGVFSNLTALEQLDLCCNRLSGDLNWIGSLPNLIVLSLENNSFSGEIPDSIGNLSRLRYLYLRIAQLSGDLYRNDGSGTSWLDGLLNLEDLFLDGNQLTGTLPADMGALVALNQLGLSGNQFSGPIPDLGALSSLRSLNLYGVPITGTLYRNDGTSWLDGLTSLEYLDLRGTEIEGTIPPELGQMTHLQDLKISGTRLSGPLPNVFSNLTALFNLQINYTPIDGPIPPSIGGLTNLQALWLDHNALTGSIPPELGSLPRPIGDFHLTCNRLSGPIPPEIGNLTIVNQFRLDYNALSGEIPASITNLQQAALVRVSYNALHTTDPAVRAFLESKDTDAFWLSQTVPPSDVAIIGVTTNSVSLSWTAIPYTWSPGGYRVLYSTGIGGPYTEFATTPSKSDGSMTVDGLQAGTTYHFVIQTESGPYCNLAEPVESDLSPEVTARTDADCTQPCDDGNPCTEDSCDPVEGCQYTPGNAGAVCRASLGPCDAVESCTGVDAACPADQHVADGSACDDGNPCTTNDACSDGQCVGGPAGTFAQAGGSPVAVGTSPRGVALGDFNLDGKLDVATANWSSNDVTILLGNGAGEFTEAAGSPVAGVFGPISAAFGDFNFDGKPDLAIANYNSYTATILLGDGAGGFAQAAGSPVAVGSRPDRAIVGDFNRDGKPDLATANHDSSDVTILLGDGTGGFTQAAGSPIAVGPAPVSIALGDFNFDGSPDLATVNYDSNSVTILLGDGAGGFTEAAGSPVAVGSLPRFAAVGDFDLDGRPDLTVTNGGSDNVTILLGNGAGGFSQAPGSPIAVGVWPFGVAVGDVNLDGKPDIVPVNYGSNSVAILLNTTSVLDCNDGNPCTDDSCDPATGCVHAPGNAGAVCRAAAGACDVAENCDGVMADCPADAFEPATVECRASLGLCDVPESCTGVNAACPTDQHLEDGSPCDDGNACTTNDTCSNGLCGADFEQGSLVTRFTSTCALRADGRIVCWGYDDWGQVSGPNSSTDSFTVVSYGTGHTCGLRTDGRLACWGYDDSGRVAGPNSSTETYTDVSAGSEATCAVRTSGNLACWGADRYGVMVSGPNSSPHSYTAVKTGGEATCALRTGGELDCWPTWGPGGADHYTAFDVFWFHGCAVSSDRRLVCWGSDSYGQVSGPNGSTDRFKAVAVGLEHTCGLRIDGSLVCWGRDLYGETAGPNGSDSRYTTVATGHRNTCALQSDGRLQCWGENFGGKVTGPNGSASLYGVNHLTCDDGNPCTDDSCDPAAGCVHTAGEAACDDGNACTTNDACSGGVCVGTGGSCAIAVDPPDNATGVAVSTNVTITYYDPIDPATVTASTFRLIGPDEVAVPAALLVSTSGTRATLDPTDALAPDTTYRVETTSGILGPGPTPTQPFTGYFRTGSAEAFTAIPTVSESTSPLPTGAKGGSSVSPAGDLNGDGIQDVISGAPGYATGARFAGTSVVEAGAALVYFGSGDAAQRAQPDIIFEGVSEHDRVGVSVAGDFDFNGDGYRDIVIGAEQVDRTTNPNSPAPTGSGKVYLIFFNPNDTVHYPNIADPAIPDVVSLSLVGQPGGIPGVVFEGAAFGDQAGFSVDAGGTFTPGGGTDIVIGAPGADPGGRTDAGAAYVVFDNPTLSGTVSLTRISSGLPDQIPGKAFLGAQPGDNLGFSTAFAGDVVLGQSASTGTVLIGAPGKDGRAGMVVAVPGDPDTTPIIVESIGRTEPGFQIVGTQPGEQLGYAVADGGDALADGVPDLLIGAPTYDVGSLTDAGRVLQTTQRIPSGVYAADAVGTTIAGVIWTGDAAGEELGFAVAGVGDVTGDGYDDIVLGAPFADPIVGGVIQTDAGAVYLIDGSPVTGYLGSVSVAEVGTAIAGQVLTGTQAGEHAGASLAGVGDISGDGRNDFAVGAPDRDADSGTVYLVLRENSPAVGSCGPAGCQVADLVTGAEVDVPAGALATAVHVTATGILEVTALPAPVPAGTTLLGAARFTPEGQPVLSPYARIHIPTSQTLLARRGPGEVLPLFYYDGSGWVAAGIDGTTGANPSYPNRMAVSATVGVLHVYAVFVNDCVNADCDDGNPCTDDACDPATGSCVHTDNAAPCDDGNACTTADTCSGGACSPGSPTSCDDGDCCTIDACDPATGCTHTANTTDPVFVQQPSLGTCAMLWPPNHGYADFTVADTRVAATSDCGTVSIQFASCRSSQPENAVGTGDGNSTRDCVYEPGALHLRAERDGACSPVGRVYTMRMVAVDVCGNTATSDAFEVGVWHDRGNAPTNGTVHHGSGGTNDMRNGTNGTYGPACGPGNSTCGEGGQPHDRSDADPEMEIAQRASVGVDDLRLDKASGGNVKLTWTEPAHSAGINVTRFHIYRLDPATLFWTQLAEVTKQTTSYQDPSLNDGADRQYKVTAVIK